MLGRQQVFFTKRDFSYVMRDTGLEIEHDPSIAEGGFAEPLFRKLGAQTVESIDASPYEKASIIADFNQPISPELHGKFTLFVDFGSFEHIYNVSQSTSNVAKLLCPRGWLLILTQANGFAGHGLYQFSPEFFYSVFSQANGFAHTAAFLVDIQDPQDWYYMPNPRRIGGRNIIPSDRSYYVICMASKLHDVHTFCVQQSDYEEGAWLKPEDRAKDRSTRATSRLLRSLANPFFFQSCRHFYHVHKSHRRFAKDALRFNPDNVSAEKWNELSSWWADEPLKPRRSAALKP
jgi:hypothetical protein